MAERESPPVETRDISPRVVWLLGLGFAAFVIASTLVLLLFFHPTRSWSYSRLAPPGPVLQISPAADYASFIAGKRSDLTRRRWHDRAAGLVEIPIEEAMRLVAEGHRAETDVTQAGCRGAACPGATPTARSLP